MPTASTDAAYDRGLMRSCIYGLAVGDALGVPYEFRKRGDFTCTDMVGDGTHMQPAGTWSDDTSMALCICSSIKRLGRVDTADIGDKFRRWLQLGEFTCDGRAFDVGETCRRSISTGVPATSYRECGNGSLMRTAPLAMLDHLDFREVCDVSAVTHAHPVAEWSCVALCDALWTVRELGAEAKGELWYRYGHIASRPVDVVESDGYCVHTLEAALWCFLNTGSYRDCVLNAVNLGGGHRHDRRRGRRDRRRVLRFRGDPAEMGRPVAGEGCDRAMHMTDEQWNIQAREEIQKMRSRLAEALEALSKPGCDFDAVALAMSKAWFNGDRVMDLIETGRNEHGAR